MRVLMRAILSLCARCVCLGALACGLAHAQPRPAQPTAVASSPYLLTRWTTENGLPQNSVTSIAQTPDGYLWVGTFGGLARFDGVRFTIFNSANTPALPNSRITALHLGRDGSLWIGAESGAITRFQQGRFSLFTRLQPLARGSIFIRAMYEDRQGDLWVGADEFAGLRRFRAGDAARQEYYDARHGLSQSTVHSICEDRDGRLWVSASNGLALFHEKNEEQPDRFTIELAEPRLDWLFTIQPHAEGGLWLLKQSSLNRFHQGRLTRVLNTPFNNYLAAGLCRTRAGEVLYSASSDSLASIKPGGKPDGLAERNKSDVVTRINLDSKRAYVKALLEDREGNLWLGTISSGLQRLRQRRVMMLNAATGLPDRGCNSVREDKNGVLWIGTGNGLCRLADGKLTTYITPAVRNLGGGYSVGGLYEARDGMLWYGLGNYVVRYDGQRFREYRIPWLDLVSAIMEDRNGQMWLGSRYGLARFENGRTTLYTQQHGLVDNDVKLIFEDRDGALWLGTPNGLSRFVNGRFTNYTTREGLSNDYVRDIHQDQDGALWLATYGGGLNRLHHGQFTHFTARQDLHDDFVSRILPDTEAGRDDFWLLGNHGIFRVSRRALNEVAAGRSRSVHCLVYNEADGMQPSEGQGGHQPAGWRARDGRFYFPTVRGVAVLDARALDVTPPPVHVERLVLDGVELDPGQPLVVEPGQSNLEIHYTGLSLGKPEQVQFSYQLSGQQEAWQDVGTRRTVYFQQLQPGTYRFNVKALSPNGVWSAQPAGLQIVVKPRLLQTWWFRGLAGLFVAGLLVLGYRQRLKFYQRRTRQQAEFARLLLASQERERERIAAELHDGLSQSLTIIKNRALSALKAPDDRERSLEQLREIAEAASQTIDEVKDVIYDLRPLHLDQLGLTVSLSQLLHEISETYGLTVHRELEKLDDVLSPELASGIYRIVQESLNNVIRHAEAQHVTVRLHAQGAGVKLSIQDDGQGFIPGQPPSPGRKGGLGLVSITERAKLLGGRALIQSTPGHGTIVTVELPLIKVSKELA